MAEEDLQRFLQKVRDLQAFVAASEADPALRQRLTECSQHQQVVDLARSEGFEIGRRWGDPDPDAPRDGNLLTGVAAPPSGEETVTVLHQGPGWRLERIHSCLALSPEDFWYDQMEHEWLCLLQGEALIRFEHANSPVRLRTGDQLHIPPRHRHRVEATDGGQGTVWLALFWKDPGA